MNDLYEVLAAAAGKYPEMQPCDAVKLVYQNEFGGGHLITDEAESLERLSAEYAAVEKTDEELFENIGNGRARLHLAALNDAALPLCRVNRIFTESSRHQTGGMDGFITKLEALRSITKRGLLPFTPDALEGYLTSYHEAGYPPAGHSAVFREKYRPAYRVIDARYCRLFPVFYAIERLFKEKTRIVAALDGPAASGKSTAAELLASVYACTMIRTDDFFLPSELRTPERYKEPGGNLHYERFTEEVLSGLAGGGPFSYRVFDCRTLDYVRTQTVRPGRLTVIEGSYSLHPRFGNPYDLRIFLSLDPKRQKERILRRNGEAGYRMFAEKWIPLENLYFETFGIRETCDYVLD